MGTDDRIQTRGLARVLSRTAPALWLLAALAACSPGTQGPAQDLRPALAMATPMATPAEAQMLVMGDPATRTQSLPVQLPAAARVRYCLQDADPLLERVRLQDAAGTVVWEQRMSLLDGRPPCPDGVHLPAGTYTLTVQTRGDAHPSLAHPVFVHSPADAARSAMRPPGPDERWPLRFVSTGQLLQATEAGKPGAALQLLDPQAVAGLDEKTLFAPVRIDTPAGEEQLRLYSQRNLAYAPTDLRQPGRSMLNRSADTGDLQLSASTDATALFPAAAGATPAAPVVAYLRPLAAYRYAYCFFSQGFTQHHCLAVRDGQVRLIKTLSGQAVGNSLASDDRAGDGQAVELVANPRYTTRPAAAELRVGEVMLDYTVASQAAQGEQGALIYGEGSSFVPQAWRPTQAWLGPDTELSLDGGQTWQQASGPVALLPDQSVQGVQIRRTAWDVLVSSRQCRGCDLRTALGRSLKGLQLPGVDLSGASLTPRYGHMLNQVNFKGTLLRGADLTGAIFLSTELAGADLTGARLRSSALVDVNFEGARLQGADLTAAMASVRTRFSSRPGVRTVLDGAVFDGAQLYGSLNNTPLACVSMRWLSGTPDFAGAGLQCVDLARADLRGARFDSATAWRGSRAWPLPQNLRQQCTASALGADPGADGVFAELPCRSASLQNSTLRPDTLPLPAWRQVDLRFARLESEYGGSPYSYLSLAGEDFSGGLFDGFDWSGAQLENADFSGASMRASLFKDANLVGARLPNTDLSCLNTQCTMFQGATLRGANFSNANVRGARFNGAVMNGVANAQAPGERPANMSFIYGLDASFDSVDLSGVNFSKAQLYGTRNSFFKAALVKTNFSGANLSQVDFSEAEISGVIFTDANLVGSRFVAAKIGFSEGMATVFDGASLHGADFSQATAYGASFNRASVPASDGVLTVKVWNASRVLVDKTYRYKATVVPSATNGSTVCANGEAGPCTASQWHGNATASPPACIPIRRSLDFEDPLQPAVDQDFQFVCPWP